MLSCTSWTFWSIILVWPQQTSIFYPIFLARVPPFLRSTVDVVHQQFDLWCLTWKLTVSARDAQSSASTNAPLKLESNPKIWPSQGIAIVNCSQVAQACHLDFHLNKTVNEWFSNFMKSTPNIKNWCLKFETKEQKIHTSAMCYSQQYQQVDYQLVRPTDLFLVLVAIGEFWTSLVVGCRYEYEETTWWSQQRKAFRNLVQAGTPWCDI